MLPGSGLCWRPIDADRTVRLIIRCRVKLFRILCLPKSGSLLIRPRFLSCGFFGWNIGGAAVEELPELLRTFESSLEEAVILLQECPRKQTGWYTQGLDGWRLVSHSASDQWRGTGNHVSACDLGSGYPKGRGSNSDTCQPRKRSGLGPCTCHRGILRNNYHARVSDFFQVLPKGARRVVFSGCRVLQLMLQQGGMAKLCCSWTPCFSRGSCHAHRGSLKTPATL